eukprot:1023870_1
MGNTNTVTVFHSKWLDVNTHQKEMLTVYGYIRSESRDERVSYVCKDIVDTVVLFYVNSSEYTTQFSDTARGNHIVSVSSKKIQKYDPNYDEHTDEPTFSTILFGDVVTSDMYNKFEIDITYRKSRHVASRNYRYFMLGFTTQRNGDYGITNWNEGIGMGENKPYSVGVRFNDGIIPYLYDTNNTKTPLKSMTECEFFRHTFTMSFDFSKDCLRITDTYPTIINRLGSVTISMNQIKSIIVAVSLSYQDDTIEVGSCHFSK